MTNGNLWFRDQIAPYLNGLSPYLNIVTTAANLAAFPVTGETTKIYIAEDTTKTYRWTGTVYAEISSTEAIVAASTTVAGIIELATTTETNAGTASDRAVTPASLTTILTKLGTIDTDADVNLTKLELESLLLKGSANGLAELDASGLVLTAQLPAYVDDVIMAADLTAIQAISPLEAGKIYVAIDTNLTYRWSGAGTTMVEISSSLALGTTSSTAYRGDHGLDAYNHSLAAHAPSNADNTAANETSHADVLQDGDFTANGFMKRTAAGVYAVDTETYASTTLVANGLEDPLVDITNAEALADINTALGL